MNRRSFIQNLIATITVTLFAPFLPKANKTLPDKIKITTVNGKHYMQWVAYEKIGVVIINPYAIAKLEIK